MSQPEIPPNVAAFIAEHVRSVVELEGLLLLVHDVARPWTAAELAQTLRVDSRWIEQELFDLARRGLVTVREGAPAKYKFASGSPLEATVRELEVIYGVRRVSVIALIYSKPVDPIQSFADAFRLRKE